MHLTDFDRRFRGHQYQTMYAAPLCGKLSGYIFLKESIYANKHM